MKKEMKMATLVRATLIVSLVILTTNLIAGFLLIQTAQKLVTVNEEKNEAVGCARQLSAASDFLTDQIRSYSATGKKEHYDAYWKEINETRRRDNALSRIDELGATDTEKKYIADMKAASDGLVPLEEEAMALVEKGDLTGALALVYGEKYQAGKSVINQNGESFNNAIAQRYDTKISSALTEIYVMVLVLIVQLLILLAVQLSNSTLIRRKVARPLAYLSKSMEEISEGNLGEEIRLPESTSEVGMLTASTKKMRQMLLGYITDIANILGRMAQGDITCKIDREYEGDFSSIKDSINLIHDSLNSALADIRRSSEQVAQGSRQVSDAAQELSSGSARQTESVRELAESINEISSQIQDSAASVVQAREYTESAGSSLMESTGKMGELVKAIDRIQETSSQIGNIISTIDNIAFQTNILALNAAVEAARAGNSGAGFAVVADEVRNLANKSGEAAKNSAALINQSLEAVENGSRLADETALSLQTVGSSTSKVIGLVDSISDTFQEQARFIERINSNMSEISEVVETNSVTAEESSSASEALSNQASALQKEVGRFRLKEADDTGVAIYR